MCWGHKVSLYPPKGGLFALPPLFRHLPQVASGSFVNGLVRLRRELSLPSPPHNNPCLPTCFYPVNLQSR